MAGAFSRSFLHVDADCVHGIVQTW